MTAGKSGGNSIRMVTILLSLALLLPAMPSRAQEAPRPVSYYVDAALALNPSISAMRQRIRMKENAAIRAGALDDPKGWIGISNVPVRSWSFREEDMTGKEIGLSQMFPYPGKLKARVDVAEREKEQTGHDFQEMRNMLRAEIRMAYSELSHIRRRIEDTRRSREILKDIVAVSQEMYAVGKVTQADVHRGHVEYGKMREMLIVLESRERILAIRLNTLAALPPDRPVPELEHRIEFPFRHGPEDLFSFYKESRPARKALEARILRGEASVGMARLEYYPDFEVSASYMQRDAMPDGTRRPDMFSSMLLMNIPVWRKDKIEPFVREMTAEREMARRELAALDLESENAIRRSLESIRNGAEVATLYRTTLIPHAETSLAANLESYRVGKVDFPMVLDSVMAVLSFRTGYHEMLGEIYMEKARLEAAVGRELD